MNEQFAFEEITEEELKREVSTTTTGRTKNKKYDDTVRTQTGWHKIPHIMGFCTVPKHDELQELICSQSEEAKEFRKQKYPNRMTYLIDPYHVCRDCYVAGIDIECRNAGLPPLELSDSNA